jgi:hypothetical protein
VLDRAGVEVAVVVLDRWLRVVVVDPCPAETEVAFGAADPSFASSAPSAQRSAVTARGARPVRPRQLP